MIMSDRLFFNRVNMTGKEFTIGKKLQLSPKVLTDPAEADLTFAHLAVSRARGALYLAIRLWKIEFSFFHH